MLSVDGGLPGSFSQRNLATSRSSSCRPTIRNAASKSAIATNFGRRNLSNNPTSSGRSTGPRRRQSFNEGCPLGCALASNTGLTL
ncbi:unnamed protein product [Meloidogyne enterolobii]|uniref:Uncharacterized protein n=1 Tax=Meloidogyne enterolobii TaxID=390850 RepID=A0ACB1B7N3_MELEN